MHLLTITRGICETNEEGYLTAVHETSNIVKTPEGAAVDNDGQFTSINAESYASMNMWGLTPEFMQTLEDGFKEFFANMGDKDIMLPFTFLLMWTAKEKLLKEKGRQICFTSILWYSTKVAFLFSLTIEFLQLFLRLGTFQLSDLCYNTLGGAMGGVLYWMGWKVKK